VTIEELDRMPGGEAEAALARCCGSSRWVNGMAAARPFRTEENLLVLADRIWRECSPEDWREAFAHHPKIGDLDSLRSRFTTTHAWARGEQGGVASASETVLRALAEGNRRYEERFGYIFIVCATGLSAEEMLARLERRMHNDPVTEVQVAAGEQAAITRLRLRKLIGAST
jgi:2-oxo-4-hydroxy-4-carboxy-5-ureidoimidazoline decarboxylase